MHDISLVKKLLNKKLYTRLIPYIKEYSVSKDTWKIIKGIGEYNKAYSTKDEVDIEEFKLFFFAIHSKSIKEEHHAIFTKYFEKLAEEVEESTLLDDVLKNYIVKDYATQVVNRAMEVLQDKEHVCLDDIAAIVNEYNREVGRVVSKTDLFASEDLSYVMEACSSKGLEWRLEELNMSLGPIRPGDFIIIAARPETGKTTCAASEVSFFASQLPDTSRPIMWVNNEESSSKVMYRIMQSYFGVTNTELSSDMEHYNTVYKEKLGGRVLVVNDDSNMNDVKRLDALFDEYNPSVIVFDQLDKVDGFHKMEREDLRIGKLYEWARDLAKKFGPVIAISQVDGSGEGQKWINKGQLRGSKTDKIGEADAIITIGTSTELTEANKRYIHVPKNKLFGGPRSQEIHRHGYFEVEIHPEIVRYIGVH